jgi:hypothetical protein
MTYTESIIVGLAAVGAQVWLALLIILGYHLSLKLAATFNWVRQFKVVRHG